MIWKEKARFLITVAGVGFSVMLMLFLFGVYEGVKKGATSYVANSPAEIWMRQSNSTNLLRSSSFLDSSLGNKIRQENGVKEVSGILRVLVTATVDDKAVTLLVFGFDPKSKMGVPSTLIQGHSAVRSGEIILDKAFAAKHNLAIGDSLQICGNTFQIVGISDGTNAIVAQFAFTKLEDAERLPGLHDIVSFYLLTTLSTLGCLTRPSSGSIQVMEHEITLLRQWELAAFRLKHIGFIFQTFRLLDSLTVIENVELVLSASHSAFTE